MPRTASALTSSEQNQQALERLASSRTAPKQAVERARIILGCAAGLQVKEIARRCHTRPKTVIKWRTRFAQTGLKDGLPSQVQRWLGYGLMDWKGI